jgi:hypothetical protein
MTPTTEQTLFRLVYRSRSALTGSDLNVEGAADAIVASSERNNARADVTGALVLVGDVFVQVLEGPRAAVEAVFERICRDLRHTEVQVIDFAQTHGRAFEAWAMKRITSVGGAERLFSRFGEGALRTGQAPEAADEAVSLMATLVRLELAAAASAAPSEVLTSRA